MFSFHMRHRAAVERIQMGKINNLLIMLHTEPNDTEGFAEEHIKKD